MSFIPTIKYTPAGNVPACSGYIKFAINQLAILERQMEISNIAIPGSINEGVRRVSPIAGVGVECISSFNEKEIRIFVEPPLAPAPKKNPQFTEKIEKEYKRVPATAYVRLHLKIAYYQTLPLVGTYYYISKFYMYNLTTEEVAVMDFEEDDGSISEIPVEGILNPDDYDNHPEPTTPEEIEAWSLEVRKFNAMKDFLDRLEETPDWPESWEETTKYVYGDYPAYGSTGGTCFTSTDDPWTKATESPGCIVTNSGYRRDYPCYDGYYIFDSVRTNPGTINQITENTTETFYPVAAVNDNMFFTEVIDYTVPATSLPWATTPKGISYIRFFANGWGFEVESEGKYDGTSYADRYRYEANTSGSVRQTFKLHTINEALEAQVETVALVCAGEEHTETTYTSSPYYTEHSLKFNSINQCDLKFYPTPSNRNAACDMSILAKVSFAQEASTDTHYYGSYPSFTTVFENSSMSVTTVEFLGSPIFSEKSDIKTTLFMDYFKEKLDYVLNTEMIDILNTMLADGTAPYPGTADGYGAPAIYLGWLSIETNLDMYFISSENEITETYSADYTD